MAHKFAIWQATSDIVAQANLGTTPNIERDGICKTLSALAQVNVYTHPSCKAPINNPANIFQQATNFRASTMFSRIDTEYRAGITITNSNKT
jgi:hypothetical protein